jgi:hypothetical protein
MKRTTERASSPGHPGRKRGFGGGRYAAPYSGSYGGEFRTDYRGLRSSAESERFPPGRDGDPNEEPVESNYGGLRHTDRKDVKR